VEIGSRLRVHRGGAYVALFEVHVIHLLWIEEREGAYPWEDKYIFYVAWWWPVS